RGGHAGEPDPQAARRGRPASRGARRGGDGPGRAARGARRAAGPGEDRHPRHRARRGGGGGGPGRARRSRLRRGGHRPRAPRPAAGGKEPGGDLPAPDDDREPRGSGSRQRGGERLNALRNIGAIVQKEWGHYVGSPIAYVALFVWSILFGGFFYLSLDVFMQMSMSGQRFGGNLSLNDLVVSRVLQNMCVVALFLTPM